GFQGGRLATLFQAPDVNHVAAIHSIGTDGIVRRHDEGTRDDALTDGSGRLPVDLPVVSRPLHCRDFRRRARVRSVHVATLSPSPATLYVTVRAGQGTTVERVMHMGASADDQPVRRKIQVSARADAPQVAIRSVDPVRLAMVGVSAEVLAEV